VNPDPKSEGCKCFLNQVRSSRLSFSKTFTFIGHEIHIGKTFFV